jgi:hypothetical protein
MDGEGVSHPCEMDAGDSCRNDGLSCIEGLSAHNGCPASTLLHDLLTDTF